MLRKEAGTRRHEQSGAKPRYAAIGEQAATGAAIPEAA